MPAKKSVAKKAKSSKTTKTQAAAVKPVAAIKTPLTRTQIIQLVAERADLEKKQAKAALEALVDVIDGHIKKRGAGEMNFLSLFKLVVVKKPATKARKGTNPFTGEEMMFKAKPAKKVIKVRPLKKVKEMVDA